MVRRLAGACVAFATVLVLVTPAGPAAATTTVAGPGSAAGFHTYALRPGVGTMPIADFVSGYDVVVRPGTAHAARMADAIRYGVQQLRRYGIQARYRGYAAPADTDAYGTIAVTETLDPSAKACKHYGSTASNIVTDASAIPSVQDVGLTTRVNSAQIIFCPAVWPGDEHYLRAVALHELGHAVGLGHFRGTYEGALQVMNPVVSDHITYQAGDVHGLRYIAAQTARLRAASVLAGVVESWQVTPFGLRFSGWAIVGHTSQFATVTVLRDGVRVYRISTATARPDVVAAHFARWPDPGFTGSEVPMALGRHRYCVVAADPSSPGTQRVLGCRVLNFPPPPVARPEKEDGHASGAGAVRALPAAAATSWLSPGLVGGLVGGLAVLVLAGWLVARRRRT